MYEKLGSMKSDDCHFLMQQFMPLAQEGLMDLIMCAWVDVA